MNRTCLLTVTLFVVSLAVQSMAEPGNRWAVLIGVNDYAQLRDLKYCSSDMQALRKHLVLEPV